MSGHQLCLLVASATPLEVGLVSLGFPDQLASCLGLSLLITAIPLLSSSLEILPCGFWVGCLGPSVAVLLAVQLLGGSF